MAVLCRTTLPYWALALGLFVLGSGAEPRSEPAASTRVAVEPGGEEYLLVRDVSSPERCYYLPSTFRLQEPATAAGKVPDVRLVRYDYRKGGNSKDSLAGAILNFTAAWDLAPGVVDRLKPAAAKLTGQAEDKVRLHPLPLADLKVTLRRPGARDGIPATTRAVHTVGPTGVTATVQLEVFEAALAETLLTAKTGGLVLAIEGTFAGSGAGGRAEARRVELQGAIGLGLLPEDVRKRAVVNLPDWVSAATLVPPAVGPDLGVDRVTIDVALGTRDGEQKALGRSLTWTPEEGWTEGDARAHFVAFLLAGLPPELRKVGREDLRFHGTVQVLARGATQKRSFAQPVIHGADFLLGGDLPVRVAEFHGTRVTWATLDPAGTVERVEVSVRCGGQTLRASMTPTRHNTDFGLPPPLRLAFLVPEKENEGGKDRAAEARAEFVLSGGKRVVWDGSRTGAVALPFSVDLLLPNP